MRVTEAHASDSGKSWYDTRIEVTAFEPTSSQEHIRLLNSNPRTRATASRQLNDTGRSILRIAREIALAEFRTRSEGRRPRPGSPHYVDSFFFHPATQQSIEQMTVSVGNSHRAARIIEKGARPHKIPRVSGTGRGTNNGAEGYVVFPYQKNSSRYRYPGQPGSWPTEYTRENTRAMIQVEHPGQEGFHIMARAVARARSRAGLDRVSLGV